MDEILDELTRWAKEHPTPNEPVLIIWHRALTPVEILAAVENKTDFGLALCAFLTTAAERYGLPLSSLIRYDRPKDWSTTLPRIVRLNG